MRELLYKEAVREALDEEMARDASIFVIGEDIALRGGSYKCTDGLLEKYGDLRCKDSPISESCIVGLGVGAAVTGCRPVVELMMMDFVMVAMDQICNQAAKLTYMSGGQRSLPMVIRTPMGSGRCAAAQHSQCLHAWMAHCPGLKVALPSTSGDVKGLIKTAIRDNNPVLVLEHKMLYNMSFNDVPEKDEDVCIPFGKARMVTEGSDITVLANSLMTVRAEKAVQNLASEGISVDLIDMRTLVPMDTDTIIKSVKKTGKLLIVDEGHVSFGISGEISLRIMPEVFYDLEAPVDRIGAPDVPIPMSPALESAIIPNDKSIAAKIREMVRPGNQAGFL